MAARVFGSVLHHTTHGYWYILCSVEGRQRQLTGYRTRRGRLIRFQGEADAHEALEEIRAELRRGTPELQAISEFLPIGTPETLFGHHYELFCRAKQRQGQDDHRRQLSRQRIRELRGHRDRGHLDPLLDVPVQLLGYAELEDWRNHLFETTKLGSKSIHNVVSDVRTCLRWLARRRVIHAAPEVPDVHVDEYAPNVPNKETQERVLSHIEWPYTGIFLARGLMGLRPSEARRADLSDYWFDPDTTRCRDVLTVRRGKGRRYRLVPTHPDVARWVRERHPAQNLHDTGARAVALFQNPRATEPGHRWEQSSERRIVLAAMKAAGVKHRPNELLRHAFGTAAANQLLGEGYSTADVSRLLMAIMGHTEVKTSDRYVRLATEGLERIIRRDG